MCTRAKHPRGKGNCANNPNCVFGLGEGKDGVWAKTPAAVSQLLQHPPVRLRGGWKRAARANAALQNDNVAVASDSDEGTCTLVSRYKNSSLAASVSIFFFRFNTPTSPPPLRPPSPTPLFLSPSNPSARVCLAIIIMSSFFSFSKDRTLFP